ncbi:MAG: response regulator [Desulfosarcinaceae bacterium]|nr:response regulator [Desulfosarcinaceae bacterium]
MATSKRTRSSDEAWASPAGTNGRVNVLVLDDDPALRELFGVMLERVGCRAEIYSSSAEAISAYRSARGDTTAFDCALIDLHIDEKIDGITVGRILREINPLVRLVLITGTINPNAVFAHKKLGFDAILLKPFGLDQLRKTIFAQH